MALPGPEAQQLATYIGWLLHGRRGGIVAGGLFVLPSVFVLLALSWIYMAYGHVAAVDRVLDGFRPAVVAVILHASVRIGRRAIRSVLHGALAAAALAALLLGVPFPFVVIGAAAAGILAHRLGLNASRQGPAHEASGDARGGAGYVIGDDSPPPAHARPSRRGLLRTLAGAAVLWGLAFGPLALLRGTGDALTEMALFFTLAALVTFGGAYAVLPFVAQVAIESRRWLTPGQMVDGLALGETTPGPLIMVVAFVGFVGAWQALGPGYGWMGCLVATWFTFLPSFAFIFAGAPHIEAVRGRVGWTAPLAAVSAAIVGVIVHLAAYLARPVFLPEGRFDVFAAALFLVCGLLLFVRKWAVHWVVLAAGATGLARAVLGL
jgi:chromate transporter